MNQILMNDEMHIYVPDGDDPAFDVCAAMFGPYTKPKAQIDHSFMVFMVGVVMAYSDLIIASEFGFFLCGVGLAMISKKVSV